VRQPLDYDNLGADGARGWSWQDVAPLFTRIESYEKGGANGRGTGGSLRVSEVPDQNPPTTLCSRPAVAAGFKLNRLQYQDQEASSDTGQHQPRPTHERGAPRSAEPAKRRFNGHGHGVGRRVLPSANAAGVVYERWGREIEVSPGAR
jgi:choline dehydrogenase